MRGTGRILGQVTEPDDGPSPGPWPFVRGESTPRTPPARLNSSPTKTGDSPSRMRRWASPRGYQLHGYGGHGGLPLAGSTGRGRPGNPGPVYPTTRNAGRTVGVRRGDGSESHRLAGLGLRESRPAPPEDSFLGADAHLDIQLLPPEDAAAAIPPTPMCLIERPGVHPGDYYCGVPPGRYRFKLAPWLTFYSTSTEPLLRVGLRGHRRDYPRPADPHPPQSGFARRHPLCMAMGMGIRASTWFPKGRSRLCSSRKLFW